MTTASVRIKTSSLFAANLLFALLVANPAIAQNSVLDVFPESGVASNAASATCSFDYAPSGSTWVEGIDEENAFLASLKSDVWQLGVGKGGHIYSLRGPFGESVAPQRVTSPWNDEVWQTVITSEILATPIHKYHADNPGVWPELFPLLYFVHQAGIYVKGAGRGGAGAPAAFYSPCLRRRWNADTKTLELVNWMQQANSPCVWRSSVLIYTAYRDIGGGAIEVNQVLHNFGDVPLDYVSSPWGGVRKTSLPHTVISKADGSWAEENGAWGWDNVPQRLAPDSGGWGAWVQNPKDDKSPALSLVVGTKHVQGNKDRPADFVKVEDRVEGQRLLLWGTAGTKKRDYEVTEQVSKLAVLPGESYSIRWYLVSGEFSEVRGTAAKLSKHAGVHRMTLDSEKLQSIWAADGKVSTSGEGKPWSKLLAFPVEGCVPVFLLEDKETGEQTITADIYALAPKKPFPNPLPADHAEYNRYQNRFVYQQYLPKIGYENLLGYAYQAQPAKRPAKKIQAPQGVRLHDSARSLWIP